MTDGFAGLGRAAYDVYELTHAGMTPLARAAFSVLPAQNPIGDLHLPAS